MVHIYHVNRETFLVVPSSYQMRELLLEQLKPRTSHISKDIDEFVNYVLECFQKLNFLRHNISFRNNIYLFINIGDCYNSVIVKLPVSSM